MDAPNLKLPDYFINRELSALEFNNRVMQLAVSEETPLLERLKFLCIVSTNLDEFFEIRVSSLKQRLESGAAPGGPDMLMPQQCLAEISTRAHDLVKNQYRLLNETIIPALSVEGIRFIRRTRWTTAQREWLKEFYHQQLEPVLSPILLDTARPFPKILNKSLNFIVGLEGIHAFGRPCHRAIVQAPRSLPRLIQLPENLTDTGPCDFVFLSSVIHAFVDELFSGMEISGCYQFRVTRNSDLYIDDEEVSNLAQALESELLASRYGAAVRLEVARECPSDLTEFLLRMFGLENADLYRVEGPVNLNRLMAVYDLARREDLKDISFTPGLPACLAESDDLFATLRRQQIFLHHPYESFAPVLEFIRRASKDPDVLAIKLTLYRPGSNSPIVAALIKAAQAGKEVTVVIELRARFDEASNIAQADRLQEAGAHVVYGVVGFKTHCKIAMVVRREDGKLRRYVHLGTGNYHPATAKLYTDYGLLTADENLGHDVHQIFLQLTSMMQTIPLRRLIQAPFQLHDQIISSIESETRNVANGGNGHIIAKLNALVEPEVIHALYKAANAGVMVDLIIRGICCLRPGIPGISENIRVRSLVGRFLEHSRVYYFHANGEENVYCASADWMDRNFFRRIEVSFPIDDPETRKRLIGDLDTCLSDNCMAWELLPDGQYRLLYPEQGAPRINAQSVFLQQLSESG